MPVNKSEQGRWKEKYLTALEDQDKLESNFNNRLDVLRRGLVRVSLAAEGIDSQLDKNLTELREVLRSDDAGASVKRIIDSLEKKVLKLDTNKKDNARKVHIGFAELSDQLIKCTPPRDVTQGLKRFKKSLKHRSESLGEYPNLIGELVQLQQGTLTATSPNNDDAEKSGFWRKLLGMDTDSNAAAQIDHRQEESTKSSDNCKAAVEEQAVKEDALELDVAESELEPEIQSSSNVQPLSARHAAKSQQEEPGFSTISEHVGVTLKELLQHLDVPETEKSTALALEQRITNGLNWYELVPVLEDLVVLVLAAMGEEQTEFENFLTALDVQLSQFESFVESTKVNQQQSDQNNTDLSNAVREQVSGMQSSLAAASDLDVLKQSVQEKLLHILSSMDTFQSAEEGRQGSLEEQMQVLINRVESMEQQSTNFKQHLEEQRKQSLLDSLTELPNRAAYEEVTQAEYARWKRYGQPLSIVIADIDFFKKVNDTYGHIAGDKVLKVVARTMNLEMRETDFIARYGGEEFVILMPETPMNAASIGADKVRLAVANCPFHFKDKKVPITISLGIAEFTGDDTIETAFQRADKALYAAKEKGRNCIVTSDD